MHIRTAAAALVLFLAVLGGCRTFTSPARSHVLSNKNTWMDYDATRRGVLVLHGRDDSGKETIRIVSEPSPDAALGVVSEFVAKASYSGISAEGSARVTESIAELGKRTQTIMFLRECMFRLNELEANGDGFETEKMYELYIKVIDTAVKLAEADVKDSEKGREIAAEAASNAKTRENVTEAAMLRELQSFTRDAFGEDSNSKILWQFWMPTENKPNPANQKELEDWMERNGLDKRKITLLLSGSMFAEARQKAVRDLRLPR